MKLWVKIAGALLGIALVTTFALSYLLVDEQAEQLTNSARELRQATADTVVLHVETFFEQVKRELGDLGALISDASQSQEQRVAAVRSKLSGARLIDRVEVFAPDGAYVMGLHAKAAAAPRPAALAEAIRKRLAAQALPHVVEHPQPKQPHLMVSVAVKTRAKRIYGYLRARVSLDPLIVDVRELAARRFDRSSASEISIVDSKHRLLMHRDRQRIGQIVPKGLLRPPGPKQFTRNISEAADFGQGEQRRVAIIVPAQSVRWGIIVQQSYDDVYKSVAAAWRKAASIAGLVALLAILGGLLIGRRIGKPVSLLADAAAQIAAGDFSARVEPRSADEVGALTRSFNSMAGSLEESRDRLIAEERVRGDMSRYLSDALVDAIVKDASAIELGGRRAKVTVLFADVVAFTPLAERHAPEDVVRLLNEMFTFLTGIVFNHGGMVDKFIGDCVMAVFGVPEQHDDDAERAALAALEMIEWLETGNAKWAAEFGRELQLGIGINTGTAIVGNLGSEKRMEFTAIGDTVNIAARLEMLAKPGQVLISEATRAELGDDFDAVDLGMRDITGRKEQIRIFDLREEA